MSSEHKTRAERIIELRAEAESLLIDLTLHAHDSIKAGSARHRMRLAFAEALALPPDPPRGSEMRVIAQAQANDLQGVIAAIDRLLAAAPKEPEPAESPAEPPQDDEAAIEAWEDITRLHQARVTSGVFVSPSTLASGVTIMRRLAREKAERDAMIADLRAKLAAAESDMLKVAQAIGIVYQADYHNDVAGPTSTIVERILAQESRIHDLSEMLAAAEARIAEMGNK